MPKLTKAVVEALRPRAGGGDLFLWDGEDRGFGVRMKTSGRASFLVQYRTGNGQTRRLVLGPVGTLTVEQARKLARENLVAVRGGRDPSTERHEKRTALTVGELCTQYLEAARAGLVTTRFRRAKRASTITSDEGRISRHIIPLIGHIPAQNLTRANVQRMVDDIAAGKTSGTHKTKPRGLARVRGGAPAATRTAELLGGVWTWAEKRGLVHGPSPTRGLDLQRSEASERVLSSVELAILGATLRAKACEKPHGVAAVRLIALTGMRREEACGLKRREVDNAGHCAHLAKTKTTRSTRALGKPALELLASVPPASQEWYFPNAAGSGSATLKKQIAELFDAAGLKDARSQALRRTFASFAADAGYGDATIAEMIGHARRGVTQRHYIRRPDAALVSAATHVARQIERALDGEVGQIVPITSAVVA